MTTLLDAPPNVIDAVRGDRTVRPPLDHTMASGLRAQLEDGLYEIMGATRRDRPLVVRATSLHAHDYASTPHPSDHGRLRGVLVNHVLRLMSVGVQVTSAFDDAVVAWRALSGPHSLLDTLDHLDADERARLATDVIAHCVTLTRMLGAVPGRWMPRSSVFAVQSLGGGNLLLRDVVDLMIGTTGRNVASVALIDVTTAPLGQGAEAAMRYHALVHTLRTSTMPLRTAVFSSATGGIWIHDVDKELLQRSVDDVLGYVRTVEGKQ